MEGPHISDEQFFDALNLNYPGLEQVGSAVGKKDFATAKRDLVEHIKRRQNPCWHFDWRDRPQNPDANGVDTTYADRYARNELVSVSVWHDFGENIDWSINPMENQYAEWTWQLSRHPFWVTLGRTYWATGDEKYAKAFVFQMNSWVHANPMPDDSGNYRGSRWRTIETGIRTGQTWFPSFYYFLSSPSFDDESIITMLKSFVEHAQHLMRWPQTGNWLTMEANGLYHIGVMLPEFTESQEWRDTAIERLYAELDNQVYPDGAQIELSSGYHQVSLRNFVMPIELAQLNKIEIPKDYMAKLEKMYHYNLYAAMPNGQLPALNDGGWTNIRGYCEQGFGYYPHRTDMQWMATNGEEGIRLEDNSYAFPYAGHFVMRSGWDEDDRYLLFDAGPFGYGHQHEDKLHFVLYAHGRVHVTDPGNYPYDSSKWRAYHISAYAHNTILIDDLPQNRRGFDRRMYVATEPLKGNWISNDDYDYAFGVYNQSPEDKEGQPTPGPSEGGEEGYGPKRIKSVTHTRQIVFVKPDYWVIFDTLMPYDDEVHTYESPFHLEADDVDLDKETGIVVTRNSDDSNLAIIPLKEPDLDIEIVSGQEEPVVQGWVAAGGYDVRAIPTPIYKKSTKGVTHLVYVFYPIPKGEKCPIICVETVHEKVGTDIKVHFADSSIDKIDVSEVGKPIVSRHASNLNN